MKTSYTVVIRKEHCIGREYMCIGSCPLFAAIKEQIPEFQIGSVGGDYVRDKNHNKWFFNASYPEGGWCSLKMIELEKGIIFEHKVTFRLSQTIKPAEEPATNVKVITKYVSVPQTISEQIKELVMQ